jgi:hypothetical protein
VNNPNAYKDNNATQGKHLWDVMLAPLFMVIVTFVALAFIAK